MSEADSWDSLDIPDSLERCACPEWGCIGASESRFSRRCCCLDFFQPLAEWTRRAVSLLCGERECYDESFF